ncbi:alkaline phosphatase family protein [Aeromicrobium sp. YIM 150415]|uniref:alkaline phosphatase family protein n=1 Tax=Aeromicrobium sp. YIM 150415 TaxID=2803912 RepID=UPI0019639FE9|nr:nucleotide pyrophosphatase/phosphodiesterase family protein [Aeromicrobium sp. YIM 150415]MBM9462657.1 alkaline phosphatase family protein [Aeromicrobium sp. YIM 150415]
MSAGIHDLLGSVGTALGAEGFPSTIGLPAARGYVVLVVDGMGDILLRDHAELAPWLSGLASVEGVESAIPSTTSVSLTSLGTGLRPGVHGMAGYSCRVPGTRQVLNTLSWNADVDPREWQPHRAMPARLRDDGIAVSVVNESRFADSGLTLCSQRDVPFIGVDRPWERLEAVVEASQGPQRTFVYAYEGRLDHTGHGKGVDSPEWREILTTIDREIAELRAELPDDVVLVVTADHGMIDLPAENRFDVEEHPELLDAVQLFAGEARFRHLYTSTGAESEVAARWRDRLGDRAVVLEREVAAERWFGPLDPAVRGRFGDVVVASLGDFAVFSSRHFKVELSLRGFHGSITPAETRVPVLVAD